MLKLLIKGLPNVSLLFNKIGKINEVFWYAHSTKEIKKISSYKYFLEGCQLFKNDFWIKLWLN